MRQLVVGALALAVTGFVATARAEDKASPAGTWKSTFTTNDGQKRETTYKLKVEGDKLTGVVIGRDNKEIAIEDGKFKDGEVSFKVTRERNGQKVTFKYTGKLDGDTIKGKSEFERNGQAQSRDWEAKRSKD